MVPQEALQVAAALAVNCWVAPSMRLTLAGEMVRADVAVTATEATAALPPEVGVAVM